MTQPAPIIPGQFVPNVTTTLYTATKRKAVVKAFTLSNVTTGPIVVTVYLVKAGDAFGDLNAILRHKTLGPYEPFIVNGILNQTLNEGDFISAVADTASAVSVHASGIEFFQP